MVFPEDPSHILIVDFNAALPEITDAGFDYSWDGKESIGLQRIRKAGEDFIIQNLPDNEQTAIRGYNTLQAWHAFVSNIHGACQRCPVMEMPARLMIKIGKDPREKGSIVLHTENDASVFDGARLQLALRELTGNTIGEIQRVYQKMIKDGLREEERTTILQGLVEPIYKGPGGLFDTALASRQIHCNVIDQASGRARVVMRAIV